VRYNLFGAPTVVTRPGDGVPSTDEVTTTYDGLGRVVRVVEPNGATTLVEPTMFRTKSWDADGNLRVAVKDVDDRVVSTSSYEDLAQQHVIDTTYRYGAFDQIDRITDALGHVTTLGYDTLGRRSYLDDPDMGPTTFTYNGFGEVVTEVNALLVPTTTTYDDLGRFETITDADGTRTFLWDAAANGTGRLAQTTSADDVVVTYAYEPHGFLESQTWTHDASQPTQESFTVDLVHDTLGRLDEVRYPDVPGRQRFVLKNVYDAATGELTRRDDATDPLAPSMLWQVDAREVDGSLAHATYGTGGLDVALTRQYDPATGRLEHIDMRAVGAGGAASPLHATAYHYTAGGAVDERIDEVAQRREAFRYDGSDRLTSWTVESLTGAFPTLQTVYDFDDLGNLEQVIENALVVDTMTYGWGGKPHVLASKNGQTYGYDAKGRQVDGPERTIGFSCVGFAEDGADEGLPRHDDDIHLRRGRDAGAQAHAERRDDVRGRAVRAAQGAGQWPADGARVLRARGERCRAAGDVRRGHGRRAAGRGRGRRARYGERRDRRGGGGEREAVLRPVRQEGAGGRSGGAHERAGERSAPRVHGARGGRGERAHEHAGSDVRPGAAEVRHAGPVRERPVLWAGAQSVCVCDE
jgi:YD repeat-containing protein